MQASLEELIARIANADQHAVTLLYKSVSVQLLGIQLRILKDRELAEEALQETFIKVWNRANSYDSSKATAAVWLNSIARNQALDVLRKKQLRSTVNAELSGTHLNDLHDPGKPLQDDIADADALSMCMETLDKNAQRCIVGIYCEGYTQAEMGELLNHPLGTVKSWIRRGLVKLRECLHEHA